MKIKLIKGCKGVKGCKGISLRKFFRNKKIPLYDAEHPARKKAIEIMEYIADYLNKPTIFDCKNGNTKWFDIEDKLTEIINKEGK